MRQPLLSHFVVIISKQNLSCGFCCELYFAEILIVSSFQHAAEVRVHGSAVPDYLLELFVVRAVVEAYVLGARDMDLIHKRKTRKGFTEILLGPLN